MKLTVKTHLINNFIGVALHNLSNNLLIEKFLPVGDLTGTVRFFIPDAVD